MKPRGIVATFHKSAGGRLELFSVTTFTETFSNYDGKTYVGRSEYDVEYSRRSRSYIFHMSGGGGNSTVDVAGVYFTSGDVQVAEKPCQLVHYQDRPPWRSKKTKAIRQRNRPRRLRKLPKAFALRDGWDLMDWLENNAIDGDAVYCPKCSDYVSGDDPCEHIWWCNKASDYSTPSERCDCKDRDECRDR